MRIPRIFLDQELTKNKTYKLDKDSFHHLLVIKKREGDKIEVFNSKGQFLEASISLINKKTCEIFSIGEIKIQEQTFPKISLGISEIKNFEYSTRSHIFLKLMIMNFVINMLLVCFKNAFLTENAVS